MRYLSICSEIEAVSVAWKPLGWEAAMFAEYRGKMAADGPRYKALGNSMAVPVMHEIGKRIAAVNAILRDRHGTGRSG